jgi:uncharacterized protein YgbK (DUF1537 family)
VTTPLAIIADDLTGGCDTGALFAGPGPVPLAVWPGTAPPAPVQVIDTESRALPPRDAGRRVRAAMAGMSAEHLFKKIDSTVRGRIGAEIEALMEARSRPTALLCPAFPAQKRVVVERVLSVGGVPVSETAVAADPEFPAAPARARHGPPDVIELLGPQFERPLSWIPLDRVRAGPAALCDHLGRLVGTVALADAETDADLDTLARAALASLPVPLLAGSAGLASALARALGFQGAPVDLPEGRRWLILAGSRHPATRRQVDRAREANLLVVSSPDVDRAERPALARDLAAQARRLVDGAAADLVVVTGGETALALLQALGASRIDLVGAPAPGLALGYVSLPGRPPLPVITKAGAFGDDDLLASLARNASRRSILRARSAT